jgi:hypothetical protein
LWRLLKDSRAIDPETDIPAAKERDQLARELECRDALIKDHLLTILQKDNRIDALDFALSQAKKDGEDVRR